MLKTCLRRSLFLPAVGLSLSAAVLFATTQPARAGATISRGLQAKFDALEKAAKSSAIGRKGRVGPEVTGTVMTIITFNTTNGLPGVANLDTPVTGLLAVNGIVPAARLESLGIITALLTVNQKTALLADSRVRSLYDNYKLKFALHQARVLCGVDKLRADAGLTAQNGGAVVDGRGTPPVVSGQPNKPQFSVIVIDSGVDTTGAGGVATNADLYYDNSSVGVFNASIPPTGYTVAPTIPASKVIQNLQVNGDNATGTVTYSENQLNNDSVGHGSHCSGIIGSLGTYSKTTPSVPNLTTEDFSGVASGVKIIGSGSGAGLFVLDALGGFEYAINFQSFYNIRITSNSYGSDGPYDAADPLNVAIKTAYDHNITNVFAAGNSGPGVDTISDSSKSPYVISVAAGTKEGGLVGFSSRGKPAVERAVNPALDAFNLPAITAPGTGREFDYNTPGNATGKGFYSDIISTRSKLPGAAAGTNDQEFPAPYQAVYTQISGTSMACPFIAGVCALLLDANINLTPAQQKAILQSTATHMPDYQDFEVGAGYVNVFAAVDLAFNSAKGYLPFNRVEAPYSASYSAFNTLISTSAVTPPAFRPNQTPSGPVFPPASANNTGGHENFTLDFNPDSVSAADYAAAKEKAKTNNNAYAFTVDADQNGVPIANLPVTLRTTIIDARIQFGNDSAAGIAGGNSIGMLLWAPDGTSYSSGIALPVLDSPTRQVVVKAPVAGLWIAELRGIRGLAAVPVTPPTGAGLPDTTTGQIYRTNNTVTNPPGDITDAPQAADINNALLNRYLDIKPDGTFGPKDRVTRGELAQVFADNMPLRQTLASTQQFSDVSGNLARIAEAVSVSGSTLRDWDFTPAGVIPTTGTTFRPSFFVSRIEVASALVRALGLNTEANTAAPGGAVTVVNNGTSYPVIDTGEISTTDAGFLKLALDRGLLDYVLAPGVVNGTTQTVAYARPAKQIKRGELATSMVNYRARFRLGN